MSSSLALRKGWLTLLVAVSPVAGRGVAAGRDAGGGGDGAGAKAGTGSDQGDSLELRSTLSQNETLILLPPRPDAGESCHCSPRGSSAQPTLR